MIRAWRLVASKYVDRIFSGGGAYRHGGRWNSPGRAVVYLSEHLSLSALELLVHRVRMHMLSGYKYMWVDIPDELIFPVNTTELPADWNVVPAPPSTKQLGDRWYDQGSSPVLRVPSTVIQTEQNFVVNPLHPQFKELKVGDVRDFRFDERLIR